MPTPDVLNFATLLTPISEAAPTGQPLRGSDPALESLFYEIRDARTEARNAETQQRRHEMTSAADDPIPAPKSPDWRKVVDLAIRIVSTQSKDLWIAAWLLEGLCRTDGFAGLRDGFRLVRELSEKYWDRLHPRSSADEQDPGSMVAQLAGVLDGVLNVPIYDIPVTGSYPRRDGDVAPRYSLSQFRRATQLDKTVDPKQRRQQVDQGDVTLEQFTRAVELTSPESFRNLLDDVDACLQQFHSMAKELDQRCGLQAAPPTTKTREALEECRSRLQTVAKDKLAPPDEMATSGAAGAASGTSGPVAGFSSRDQAFQTLLRVADYFRKQEPHSVVSYALEQVVRWGRMSLPDLLTDLIADKKARQELFRQTGISAKGDESSSE